MRPATDVPTEQLPLELPDAEDGEVRSREVPRVPLPARIRAMSPTEGQGPFDDPGYFFEPWWPGIRALVFIEGGRIRLRAEALSDPTAAFPELADLPPLVAGDGVVLDATLLVLDHRGRPSPELLRRRLGGVRTVRRPAGAADGEVPVVSPPGTAAVVASDLLYLDGRSLAGRPFGERRGELAALLRPSTWCLPGRGYVGEGVTVARALGDLGFRHLSARRLDARLRAGPAGDAWFRVPVDEPARRALPPFLALVRRLPLG